VKHSVTQDSIKRKYNTMSYIAPCEDTQRGQTWITQFYLQVTPCLPFASQAFTTDGATPN